MVSLADRLKNVHPDARTCVRDTAKYDSAWLMEYYIRRTSLGHYEVVPYGGGQLPTRLRGTFTNFFECERKLIQYLKSKDKWGKAIYPDEQSRGQIDG